MTYATGSGSYTALMAAVLAFAIADGWTTSGGNWPISKGNVRGVDWSSRTAVVNDYTSGSLVTPTERILEIAIGTSRANATANAAVPASCVQLRSMQNSVTEWFLFSDPASFNYIHGVIRQSNGVDADVYQHFSFGELDKGGLTYTACAYAAASCRRPYVALPVSASTTLNQSYDWNCGLNKNCPAHFSGFNSVPQNYDRFSGNSLNNIVFILSPTVSPVPTSGGWPQPDTVGTELSLADTTSADYTTNNNVGGMLLSNTTYGFSLNFVTGVVLAQPYSGGVSLTPLPFILMNGTTTTASGMWLGIFPGVRLCSLSTFAAKDEVTYASDTWKLMPLLKKTAFSAMQGAAVSSGESGYAYKKVA